MTITRLSKAEQLEITIITMEFEMIETLAESVCHACMELYILLYNIH